MKTNTEAQRLNLKGNLGGNPEERTIPAKQIIKPVYDEVTDGPVEKVIDLPERNFLTFSVACGGSNDIPLRWIDCVDWEGTAFRARKGDTVELYGFFENRSYTSKDGNPKTVRQFVVENCTILRMKVRDTVS